MKKILKNLSILFVFCCLILFSACASKSNPKDPCESGHTLVTDNAVAATCTKAGLTQGSHCSICKKIVEKQEVIAALGHTPQEAVKENETLGTCSQVGSYDSVIYCKKCNTEVSKTTIETPLQPNNHSYQSQATPPTCTSSGYTTNTCTDCGHSFKNNFTTAIEHTGLSTCPNCNYNSYNMLVSLLQSKGTYTYASYGGYYYYIHTISQRTTYTETDVDFLYYPNYNKIVLQTRYREYRSSVHSTSNTSLTFTLDFTLLPTPTNNYDFDIMFVISSAIGEGSGNFSASSITSTTASITITEGNVLLADASTKGKIQDLSCTSLQTLLTEANKFLIKNKKDLNMTNFGFVNFPIA